MIIYADIYLMCLVVSQTSTNNYQGISKGMYFFGKYQGYFTELKESEVLQVCRSANIITNDFLKILGEKLDKWNTAVHPSTWR